MLPLGLYGCAGEASKITRADHICQARAATPKTGAIFAKSGKQDDVILPIRPMTFPTANRPRVTSSEALQTLRKSPRHSRKIGRTSTYSDAARHAEMPEKAPGLHFMDSASAAAECVTLMPAGGYVIHTFPIGGLIRSRSRVIIPKMTGARDAR